MVLVQAHLEEQLWKTRTCLSLLRGSLVNRQGVQGAPPGEIEAGSHPPNLGWEGAESKQSLF